jgi:hypothetical protein
MIARFIVEFLKVIGWSPLWSSAHVVFWMSNRDVGGAFGSMFFEIAARER